MTKQLLEYVTKRIKHHGNLLAIFIVGGGIFGSVVGAYLLRFDFNIAQVNSFNPEMLIVPALIIKGFVIWRMNLFHSWWRYASLSDVVEIFKATVISSLCLTFFAVLAYRLEGIPRSVLVLDGVLTFFYLAGIRFVVRLVQEVYLPSIGTRPGASLHNILVVGAGEAGQSVVREIRKSPALKYNIVGFLDDDPLKRQLKFQGIPVLGPISEISRVATSVGLEKAIIAIPGATGREMRRIVDVCNAAGVKVQTLPGIAKLIDGRVSIQQIRDVDVADLLGRGSVKLDLAHIQAFLQGKRVLVTGAAGSIGSELCRQIVAFDPGELILLDNAESPLFLLENELQKWEGKLSPVIGDVRDELLIDQLFQAHQPEVVFHAAAYKHVPMMELHPRAAVEVNMKGTRILADAADRYHVGSFVMISTDKAVRPANVMGTSKRAAEVYIQDLNRRSATAFITVRFGNVLDSVGSVIPIFREQIKSGGPVTVTHPDVTRFFMTIPEASQLVLQAACMGEGGEIYLLDMGEPVKIIYLAEEMIRLSGFVPHEEIEIVFSGLRPGEKLFEELLLKGENLLPTSHAAIRVAAADKVRVVDFIDRYASLAASVAQLTNAAIRQELAYLVPEYRPRTDPMGKIDAG